MCKSKLDIFQDIILVIKTYFGMVPGSLKGAFLGNLSGSSLVFQLISIQWAGQLNCYRVSLSDGKELSHNILFYQNLNPRAKAFVQAVENGTFPFLNILEFDIIGNIHLVIADFKFVKTFTNIVGSPEKDQNKQKIIIIVYKYLLAWQIMKIYFIFIFPFAGFIHFYLTHRPDFGYSMWWLCHLCHNRANVYFTFRS